jgi:pyrroloquinoline quinone biosynthesis protein B
MRVRLLGTAAGGGFPQWNCNCGNCRGVRAQTIQVRARTQSCVALSADGRRWFLLNASPDLRVQLESSPSFWPPQIATRGTTVEAVLLSDADLDHTLGLLLLREGGDRTIYATASVRNALSTGLGLADTLSAYCRVTWREPVCELAPLMYADGSASGLDYAAIPLSGKPPRYMRERVAAQEDDEVGYRFVDERTGGRLLFLPSVVALDEALKAHIRDCDVLLLDGTFWSEHEMQEMGAGTTTAAQMGHLPVGGADGSLRQIAALSVPRVIYTHINNTNPMLREDGPEHAAVRAAGAEIGWDGLTLDL